MQKCYGGGKLHMNINLRASFVILGTASIFAVSCNTVPKAPRSTDQVCDGVYALVAQEITAKYDITNSRLIATKLVAAAEADVQVLKSLKEAKADATLEAKLGSELKAVVETKSKVTTEFFQQDQSFAQTACFINSTLAKPDITQSDKAFFEGKLREIANNRVTYLELISGVKKN